MRNDKFSTLTIFHHFLLKLPSHMRLKNQIMNETKIITKLANCPNARSRKSFQFKNTFWGRITWKRMTHLNDGFNSNKGKPFLFETAGREGSSLNKLECSKTRITINVGQTRTKTISHDYAGAWIGYFSLFHSHIFAGNRCRNWPLKKFQGTTKKKTKSNGRDYH